jgi:predicted amidohydrolase
LYLSTRCLENRLPLVASNTVSSRRYSGRSVILVPKQDSDSKIVYSKALATGGESQEVLVANLDLETARNLRESRLAERRPSTYRLLQTPHSQLA